MSFWIKFMGSDSSSSTSQFYIHGGAWSSNGWGFGMKARYDTVYISWSTPKRVWEVSFTAPSTDVWHHFGITWGWWNGLTAYVVSYDYATLYSTLLPKIVSFYDIELILMKAFIQNILIFSPGCLL